MNSKIRDNLRGKWIESMVDFSSAIEQDVFGLKVPVVSKEELLRYKQVLGREVDVEDIKNIS